MKRKLLIVMFLFLFQIGFSQTGRLVHGKVVSNETPIVGVEVININSKSIAITDRDGHFAITASPKDILVFVTKNYEPKKVFLDQNSIGKIGFTISLIEKRQQLEEVVITSETKPKFDSQKIVDIQYFDDEKSSPKNRLINDGTIENGVDFVRIYKDVIKKTKQ